MIKTKRILFTGTQRGGMLVELLLTVALAAMIIPFLFQYQSRAITRAQNIVIASEMENIQTALERYIVANREQLLRTVGRNITRIEMSDLYDFGLNKNIDDTKRKYQLRIIKNAPSGGKSTLQGVVVMSDSDISPMRTREIVSTGGGQIGFIDASRTYGAFNSFRADNIDLGITATDGIVATTPVNRDNALYLWRVPSGDARDATMQTGLNLGNHDIKNITFFNGTSATMDTGLTAGRAVANSLIFQSRSMIDGGFDVKNATVSGTLSSDSRSMNITGGLKLSDVGKFSSFSVSDLWVTNLTLAGLSISDSGKAALLHVNDSIDMTGGHIKAMYVTVGFDGSITPRLIVSKRIEDSVNSNYYWDVSDGKAHFMDAILKNLNIMAAYAARDTRSNTVSYQLFAHVATNKNATVADYMNALREIQTRVSAKYSQLNL